MEEPKKYFVGYVLKGSKELPGNNVHERVTIEASQVDALVEKGLVCVFAGPFTKDEIQEAGGMSKLVAKIHVERAEAANLAKVKVALEAEQQAAQEDSE